MTAREPGASPHHMCPSRAPEALPAGHLAGSSLVGSEPGPGRKALRSRLVSRVRGVATGLGWRLVGREARQADHMEAAARILEARQVAALLDGPTGRQLGFLPFDAIRERMAAAAVVLVDAGDVATVERIRQALRDA